MLSLRELTPLQGVSETLYIPLKGRALAREAFPALRFEDASAERIVRELDLPLDDLKKLPSSVYGVARRCQIFVREARRFFELHPRGQGVNLGCGLADYFQFIDTGSNLWIDVDLSPVIEFRKRLFPDASPRNPMLAGSILSRDWLMNVDPKRPTFLLLEGVSMFLTREEMKLLMDHIAAHFRGPCAVSFDHFCKWMIGKEKRHPLVRRTGARFLWGVRGEGELESLHPDLVLQRQDDVLTGLKTWWSPFNGILEKITGTPLYSVSHLRFRGRGGDVH